MNVDIIGLGYVGLVAAACLSDEGHQVTGYDIDSNKIKIISKGEIPFYEPGLTELVKKSILNKSLNFKTVKEYKNLQSDVVMLAVGTPLSETGNLDISQINSTIKWVINNYINNPFIIVKSTVPPGTGEKIINNHKELKNLYISNPEFLREGQAINDWKNPDRIISGANSNNAHKYLKKLYNNYSETTFVNSDITSSEMIKFASNAFLANKISFINEIANLCDKLGAYVDDVAKGIGLDPRIGPNYLIPGVGYGGSCFPKDIQSLNHLSMTNLQSFDLLQSIITTNQKQQLMPYFFLLERFTNLSSLNICILGLSFKSGTDDIRESPSINLIKQLSETGAVINVYDPVSIKNAKKTLTQNVNFHSNVYNAIEGSEVIIIMTDWPEFKKLNWEKVNNSMINQKIIYDGKNFLDTDDIINKGFEYFAVGRKIKFKNK